MATITLTMTTLTFLATTFTATFSAAIPTSTPMIVHSKGWQAIVEGDGVSIAITGMLIVFFALLIISLFIRLLPAVLTVMEPILPKLGSHANSPTAAEQLPSDNEKIVAAIGYVLHLEMEKAAQSK